MIRIGKPTVKTGDSYSTLITDVTIDNNKESLWFKVEKKYGEFLCYERSDAYLVAVLNYAMVNHHDIVLEAPVSEGLLFKIENILVPALIESNPTWHTPNIIAEIAKDRLPNAGAVGTGISCGVDSLHAVAKKTGLKYKSFNISHLTFNNVGSHGEGEEAHKRYLSRLERPKKFAQEYGFELVISDSNLMDVIKQNHFWTHTYSSMFPVLCLQKLFSVYFYASSGYKYSEISFKRTQHIGSGSYEPISLHVFSTDNTSILSEGTGLSRMEKIKGIADYKPSYKYLNVCLDEEYNCGKCSKCVRTLLELDALGILEKYSAVFDIEDYKKNRKQFLVRMLSFKNEGRHDFIEMVPYFKKDLTLEIRLRYLLKRILKFGYNVSLKIPGVNNLVDSVVKP